jgi:hypothetical protein
MIAVRWYLRYGLSYRDVEELLAERGIAVDHVTTYRWVQQFTPLLIDAAPIGSGYPAAASRGRSTPTRSLDGRNTFIAATECDRVSAPPLYTLPHDPNRPPMQPATLLRQRPSPGPAAGSTSKIHCEHKQIRTNGKNVHDVALPDHPLIGR